MRPPFIKFIFIISFLIIGCYVSRRVNEPKLKNLLKIPSGTIRINQDLFFDKGIVTNLQWREYMYWTEKIFGKNSKEYYLVLPDTNVWSTYLCYIPRYANDYLRSGAFINNPVVGISQSQAEAYSNWRSDRVFEYILIRLGKLKHDKKQSKETYFTISKYYEGKIMKTDTLSKFSYYPKYRLPNLKERALLLKFSDSLDLKSFGTLKILTEDTIPPMIMNLYWKYFPVIENSILNLRGINSEWLAEPNIAGGGAWRNHTNDTFKINYQNAYTGFRNVCEWKRWEE